MTSFLANTGYTAQSDTDCPMMAETTKRHNTKLNLASKPKTIRPTGTTAK